MNNDADADVNLHAVAEMVNEAHPDADVRTTNGLKGGRHRPTIHVTKHIGTVDEYKALKKSVREIVRREEDGMIYTRVRKQ